MKVPIFEYRRVYRAVSLIVLALCANQRVSTKGDAKSADVSKKRILIVEDDPDTRDIVSVILEDAETEVLKAVEAPALTDISWIEPDLILLDEWLPNKKGSELCLEVKRNEGTAHIPVILISAVCDLDVIARNCRADGFIKKPFDIELLKQVVSDCLLAC